MKIMRMSLVILLMVAMLTGCAANSAEPAPTTEPAPTATDAPADAAAEPAEPFVLVTVGKRAEMVVGEDKLKDAAYYLGNDKGDMVLPLAEVSKALGFAVTEGTGEGPVETTITKDGMDDVRIAYTRPKGETAQNVGDVSVQKGSETVDVGNMPMPIIHGVVYVTEAFFEKVLESIDVNYDGEQTITIAPRG